MGARYARTVKQPHATPFRRASHGDFVVQAYIREFSMGKQTEERLRELADAIPQIVWIAAPDGGLTYLNAKATDYTGVGTDQLTGWSWDRVIHPDDLPHTLERWKATLGDGVPRDKEFRILRVDGTYRWHITREVPVRDTSGAISSWYGTCTDIEDLKQAGEALRQSDRASAN